LLKIQIDDPTDVKWIAEKNRRLRAGETLEQIKLFPPFGRPQRKISKMTNLGQINLNLDDKIEQLSQAVNQGLATSVQERGKIALQLANIVGEIKNIEQLTPAQIQMIEKTADKLGISDKWQTQFRDLGRIINSDTFNANKGPISLFLLSNIPANRSLNEPLLNVRDNGGYRPVALLKAFQMRSDKRYLDLEDRTLETEESLRAKGIDIPDAMKYRAGKSPVKI